MSETARESWGQTHTQRGKKQPQGSRAPSSPKREGKEMERAPLLRTPHVQEGFPPSGRPLIPSPESLNPLWALPICHSPVLTDSGWRR